MGFEFNLTSMGKDFISKLKQHLGDDENSPDWESTDEMSIGIALGANTYNVVLWQNEQYWVISNLPF